MGCAQVSLYLQSVEVAVFFVCVQPIEGSDDDDGRTPLSFAAMHGQLEAVRLLLDRGASVDKGRVRTLPFRLCVGASGSLRGLCC